MVLSSLIFCVIVWCWIIVDLRSNWVMCWLRLVLRFLRFLLLFVLCRGGCCECGVFELW